MSLMISLLLPGRHIPSSYKMAFMNLFVYVVFFFTPPFFIFLCIGGGRGGDCFLESTGVMTA